jgi:hypothetical protein
MWANGFPSTAPFQSPPTQTTFATNNLSGLFNTNEPSVFDPIASADASKQPQVMAQSVVPPQRPSQPSKILTGDLESSLTSLVENLTMDAGESYQSMEFAEESTEKCRRVAAAAHGGHHGGLV